MENTAVTRSLLYVTLVGLILVYYTGLNIGTLGDISTSAIDKLMYVTSEMRNITVMSNKSLENKTEENIPFSDVLRAVGDKNSLRNYTSASLCTHGLLRQYYDDHHYYPGKGRWKVASEEDYYQSDICKLSKPRINGSRLRECLSKSNITSITSIGDSNGMRFGDAIYALVNRAVNGDCSNVGHEKCEYLIPDKNYYNDTDEEWTKHISASYRHCACCGGSKKLCRLKAESRLQEINFQHIGLTQVVDDSIQIKVVDPLEGQKNLDKIWAPTFPEFIFRYYMKHRYPDLLVIFLPFNHAKVMYVDRVTIDINYFKMAELYIPKTTKIFFIPLFAEFEGAREGDKLWYNKRFENRLATEQINLLNQQLYRLTEPDLLDPNGRIFGFFDTLEISRSRGNWSVDAVHMKPVWYESTMSIFWDLFCGSVELDDF